MTIRILTGDCRDVLKTLPDASVHCVVTSPPYYGLRSYLPDEQGDKHKEIGLEQTPDAYVAELVGVFREARRVLRDDGTLWINLGQRYAYGDPTTGKGGSGLACGCGSCGICWAYSAIPLLNFKAKDELNTPHLVAMALQADGWFLRQTIIWAKPHPMPERVYDRCTKAHEYVFLMSKSARYWYDADAIREDTKEASGLPLQVPKYDSCRGSKIKAPYADVATRTYNEIKGANRRSVWTIASEPYKEAHFATMPPDLADLCIKAGCPSGGTVLDPFGGAGTTALAADRIGRNAISIDLSPGFAVMMHARIRNDAGMFAEFLS